jgi:hypothetical protein
MPVSVVNVAKTRIARVDLLAPVPGHPISAGVGDVRLISARDLHTAIAPDERYAQPAYLPLITPVHIKPRSMPRKRGVVRQASARAAARELTQKKLFTKKYFAR